MALKGYGKYEVEALDEERAELDRKFGEIFKLKVGRSVVRLLPPAPDERSPWRLIHVHFIELPDGLTIPFVCPKRMKNAACPICEQAEKLRKSGNPANFERAKKYFARRQWYANIIDRNDEDKGPQLIAVGKEILDQLNNHIRNRLDEDPDFDITDPYEGADIIITRKGTTQQDTEYTVALRTSKGPLGRDDDTMQAWIDARHDLNARATPMGYDEILASLRSASGGSSGSGGRSVGDGGRPKQQLPSRPRRTIEASVTKPSATSEDDYDEDEDFYDDGDDAPPSEDEEDIPF